MKNIKQTISILATATLLTACGGGDDTGTAAAGSSGSTDFSNLAQCVANRWEMGAEQVKKGLETVGGSSASGVAFSVTGNQISEFSTGGSYKGTPNYTISFTRGGTSGTSQYAGTATGTWSVDGDKLTITRTTSSVTVTNTIGGVTTTYGDGIGSPSTVKVISCTPATLTYDQTLSSGAVVRIVLVSA
ncbi:MAG TPA: hypothetical protein PKC80_06970 [Burkholderiaceae bacterium]|nr:hypothetical protein [Burkholderiaceae bacterium]